MKVHDEQFREYKMELTDIDVKLFSLEIRETDDLMTQHMRLGKALFDYSVRLKKLFEMYTPESAATSTDGDAGGVKLPKLEVPTFNGNILHWRSFWEQFSISVHGRSNLSAAEKLVYLQQALKGSPARSTIEGLSRTEGIPKKPKQDTPTRRGFAPSGSVASHTANTEPYSSQCILCKPDKHPLYACPKFKGSTATWLELVGTLSTCNRV